MDSQILDTESKVLRYLEQKDFSASKFDLRSPTGIQTIRGGTTNFTYRLLFTNAPARLSNEGFKAAEPSVSSAILKYAAEYATNDPLTPFSSERQLYESGFHLIKTPELYYYDDKAHVIVMEDVCPPVVPSVAGSEPLFISLEKMCQSPVSSNALSIVGKVGRQLGHFLSCLHGSTKALESDPNSTTLRDLFRSNDVSKEIDVQTCFRDIPKMLNKFKVAFENAEKRRLVASDYLERPESIIMGDLWFGNIILKLSGTTEEKVLEEISIIDWEFATCAPSYIDLAHLLSEIWLQDRFFPGPSVAASANQQLAIATFKLYSALGGTIDRQKLVSYVGGHACCFLDFMDWNDTDGVKRAVAGEGAIMLLQADAGQWDSIFKNSPFLEALLCGES